MNPVDALRSSVEALRRNLPRTLLTALGLVIGTGAVIAMLAVGTGARERLAEQIRSLGANLIAVHPGAVAVNGVRQAAGSRRNLTIDDAAAIEREVPGIQVAAPVVRGSGQLVAGNLNWETNLFGGDAGFLEAREWRIARGRGFTSEETSGSGKVIIIGETVAEALFGGSEAVGQTIRLQKTPLQVVGVLARKGQNTQGADQDDVAIVPLSTAQNRVFGISRSSARAVSVALVKVREGHDMAVAESGIRDLLRQRHGRGPGQEDDVTVRNLAEVMARRDASARTMTLLLGAIAAISLVVGGIGVMNVMLVSVTERTREIGVRRAVGARRRDVLLQFLVEAGTLSALGAGVGVVIGVLAASTISALVGWPALVRGSAISVAVLCSVAIGTFFGFYPAVRAARLPPILALRHE